MLPPLSPPRGLVAVRTPRGVLLHWDPPELVPKRLDGYVLEGRQGSQGWEVLDRAVAGTEMQLLVPGLIKVCAGHGRVRVLPGACQCPAQSPTRIFSPRFDHLHLSFPLHPYLPTAKSLPMGLEWAVLGLIPFLALHPHPAGCSL